MDYRRLYWLLFLGAAVLFGLLTYLDFLAAGEVTLLVGLYWLVAVAIVAVSAYAATYPDRVGGPEEPNARFALALVAFVLFLFLVLQRLVGF